MNQVSSIAPKKALLKGAAWAVGMRWSIKGIGFFNTIILARILVPQDFGVVAMAMLIVGLIQAFLDFGTSLALLRKDTLSPEEINSAWTLNILQGWSIGLLLILGSPVATLYFAEPRVSVVLVVLGCCIAISGSGNIGLVLARRELNFSLEFWQQVICKILGVVATLSATLFVPDYRALVIGVATGYLSGWATSYLMHPYRPHWETSKIPEIWSVTKWLMLAGVGGFFLRKSDELAAGRIGSTTEFGLYNVGSDLGQLPTGELGPAMLRAFLPVLSSIQADVERTNQAVLKTLSAVNTITLPVGLGFAAIAAPATALLLGDKWLEATPFVACFALAGAVQFALSPLNTLLVLRGHTRIQNHIVWIEFAVFVTLALALIPQLHLLGLVWARIGASLVNALVTVVSAKKHCGLPLWATVQAVWRPLLGALTMYLTVAFCVGLFESVVAQLAAGILSGVLLYGTWTTITWLLVGRPEGLESTVFDYFANRAAVKNRLGA